MSHSRTSHQITVGRGLDGDGLLRKTVKEQPAGPGRSSVESEGELVEVVGQVFPFDSSLVGSQQPPLQERRDAMNSRQQAVSLFPTASGDPLAVPVACGLKPKVRRQSIGHDDTARLNSLLGEADETLRRGILGPVEADSPSSGAPNLGGHRDESLLADVTPSPAPLHTSDEGLVHLDLTLQPVTAWPDHGPANLMKPRPRGLVTPKAEDALKPHGAGTVFLARDPPHDLEPEAEGLAGPVENGARRDGGLVAAFLAMQETTLGKPCLRRTASRASEAAWPTKP